MPRIVQVHFEGRFGNQLFQYAFGRALAEILGAELQTPEWIGQTIFEDAGSKPLGAPGRVYNQEIPSLLHRDAEEVITLRGFWQATRFLNYYSAEQVRRWFKLRPEVALERDTEKYLAFHIRRGDMADNPREWATVARSAYGRAIKEQGFDHLPITEVSELNPHLSPQFDLSPELQFLVDFQILMHAEVLFRANSSFSWWAGTLGDNIVFSPRVNGLYGEVEAPFEQGNHCPFTSGKDSPDVELLNETEWANHWVYEGEGLWWFNTPESTAIGPFPHREAAVLELYKLAQAEGDI